LFLCPGDVTVGFMNNLTEMQNLSDNIKGIRIDCEARPELLAGLYRANLDRATLFPGLDGFAGSLWTRVEILKRLERINDSESPLNFDNKKALAVH
jgi:hypothetical protein